MSFLVYDAIDKVVSDTIGKLNPFEIARKKTADMANDALLKGAEHVIPGLKDVVDFGSGVEDKVQRKALGIVDTEENKAINKLGLENFHKGVTEEIDKLEGGANVRKNLGMDDNTLDIRDGISKTLINKGYRPSTPEIVNRRLLSARQYQLNYITENIDNISKQTLTKDGQPLTEEKKQDMIRRLKNLGKRILDGDEDGTGKTYDALSKEHKTAYYDNILDNYKSAKKVGNKIVKDGDIARVNSWNGLGKKTIREMTTGERLAIRDRLLKVAKDDATLTAPEKTKLKDWLTNNQSKQERFALTKRGQMEFIKPDKAPDKETIRLIRKFRHAIKDSEEFAPKMKNNLVGQSDIRDLKFTTKANIGADIIPHSFTEPITGKGINSTTFDAERTAREAIQKKILDDDFGDPFQNIDTTPDESGEFNHALFDRPQDPGLGGLGPQEQEPIQFVEPDPTIQQPGQEPEDFELGEIKRPEEEEEQEPEEPEEAPPQAPAPDPLSPLDQAKEDLGIQFRGDPGFGKTPTPGGLSRDGLARHLFGDNAPKFLSQDPATLTGGDKELFDQMTNELDTTEGNIAQATQDEATKRAENIAKAKETKTARVTKTRNDFINTLIKKDIIAGEDKEELKGMINTHPEEFQEVFFPDSPHTGTQGAQLFKERDLFQKIMNSTEGITAEDLNILDEVNAARDFHELPPITQGDRLRAALGPDISAAQAQAPEDIIEEPDDGPMIKTTKTTPLEQKTTTTTEPTPSSAPTATAGIEGTEGIQGEGGGGPDVPSITEPEEEPAGLLDSTGKKIAAGVGAVTALGTLIASKDAIEQQIEDIKKLLTGSKDASDEDKKNFEELGKLQGLLKEHEEEINRIRGQLGGPTQAPVDGNSTNQRNQLSGQLERLRNDLRNLAAAQSSRGQNLQIVNNPTTQQSTNNKARDKLNEANFNIKDLKGRVSVKTRRLLRDFLTFQKLRKNKLLQLQAQLEAKKEGDKRKEERIRAGTLRALRPKVILNIKNTNTNKPINKVINKPLLTNKVINKPTLTNKGGDVTIN